MTRYVLAPDSFKESMTAKEVCQAMAKGIKEVDPAAKIISVPMADGGEGTVASLVDATDGHKVQVKVTGPLGQPVKATYGLLGDGQTAVIEMAQASGLELVPPAKRNPLKTTTFGTGQLVKDAIKHGARKIIIGLGGSATTDGGAGMAQALGAHLLDQDGQEIAFGGGALKDLVKINPSDLDPGLKKTQIILASDVTNPLVGPQGAAKVFSPQKGATPAMVAELENNLRHFARIIRRDLKKEVAHRQAAGAAGGLGAGLMAFTNCRVLPGVQVCINVTHLAARIEQADYVFTGEGGTDFQTKFGKTPLGVALLGRHYGKPVISLAGYLGQGINSLYQYGFTAFFGILPRACSLREALKEGPANVTRTTANIVRLLKIKH